MRKVEALLGPQPHALAAGTEDFEHRPTVMVGQDARADFSIVDPYVGSGLERIQNPGKIDRHDGGVRCLRAAQVLDQHDACDVPCFRIAGRGGHGSGAVVDGDDLDQVTPKCAEFALNRGRF